MKIRTSLFVFALAVLLPVAVCSAIAAVAYERQQRRAVERTGVERARALAGSVDRELAAAVMTLKALTTARTLELDDLPAFQQDVRRALATQSGWADIVLSSPAGHALITTVVPGETRPAPTREPAAFWAIARSGTPEVGPLVPDARTGRFAFLVSVPVIRHGVVQYILTAAIDATVMREVLARQHIPGVWVGTIVDPRRTIVARTQDPAELTGRPLPPELARLFSGDPESWGIARTVEGGLAYTAVSRSLTTGWGASLAIPRAAVDAPLRPWLWTIATGAAVLLAACAASSVLVGRRIAGPITALAKTAKEVERQGDVPTTAVESGPAEVREVAGALVKVAERQRQTEAERADLLIASEAARAASEIGRQAAARLAAIVEGANDAIASKTLAGIITSWNPAAERLFGWAAAEAIGQPITLIIPPERHDEERDILARISRGERIVHFETERVAKDGHRLAISLTISPVRAPSGEIVGASKIARDVSEQKRIEVERAELLGREQAARAQAESASRAKDEFLAMLGHELRNPLNVVVAAVEVLHLAGHDEATAAKARDAIQRQIRHLTELVDDLLDVARVTAGKITLSPRPVDLGALVARSIQGLRGAGRLSRHVVQERIEPAWVNGDETRLGQVIANLLGNSTKFTPPGGDIGVAVYADGESAVFRVEDSGVGMAREELLRVFDPFVQSEQSLDRSRGGLGLGLTLVQRLIELHGGTVTAASEGVGRGAVFTVRLPRIATPSARSMAAHAAVSPVSTQRVLIVEDDRDARDMLRMMLELQGHEVHEAADGPAGVERALSVRPDTAIIDIELPRMDGYDVARWIRSTMTGLQPRLVALTGYGREADRQRAVDAGFDAHLVKPVDPEHLARALATDSSA